MSLFLLKDRKLKRINKIPFKREKEIQNLIEENINDIFDLDFVGTEFSIKDFRFDTLAYDKDTKSFVIIEYKNNKNFNVIDQGYTYLSLLLNNMADFVLYFNEIKNQNLGKGDFDWTQSKVVFIAPEFTKYQKHAINFKDMPIELWEISRYKNGTVLLNQLKPVDNRASIKKITPIGSELNKPIKKLKPYTESEHLKRASEDLVEVYGYLKEEIEMWGDVEIKPLKVYIAFKSTRNFADVEFMAKSLKIWLNLKKGILKDPRKMAKDVSNLGHHGNGDYELSINPANDLKYVLKLIKQSYDMNST